MWLWLWHHPTDNNTLTPCHFVHPFHCHCWVVRMRWLYQQLACEWGLRCVCHVFTMETVLFRTLLYCSLHFQFYVLSVFRPSNVSLCVLPVHLQWNFITAKAECLLPFASVEFDQSFILKSNIRSFCGVFTTNSILFIPNSFLSSHFEWDVVLGAWKACLLPWSSHRQSELIVLSAGYMPRARCRIEWFPCVSSLAAHDNSRTCTNGQWKNHLINAQSCSGRAVSLVRWCSWPFDPPPSPPSLFMGHLQTQSSVLDSGGKDT